ncbi:hypothetical protein CDCA_CDCA13G3641 [Cyanidium caldarium]|uniref:Histone deacetylase complex subunit SAP30 Sin3 binding domain-containing protein n=1 Tax=Cyanidium caldarium TaxID=2771 RepID=A0AAV9IZQ5_CYACA|nr:hypothetical protein CDCA_CDCA13G3641 [Cyanidium caldarium]
MSVLEEQGEARPEERETEGCDGRDKRYLEVGRGECPATTTTFSGGLQGADQEGMHKGEIFGEAREWMVREEGGKAAQVGGCTPPGPSTYGWHAPVGAASIPVNIGGAATTFPGKEPLSAGGSGSQSPKSPPNWAPDPDDALLPQGTRVRIIGNNRTKSRLVGEEGAVKSAAPIGGWHVIQLDRGRLIRVQRNAIQVLSIPEGAALVETQPGLKLKRERVRTPSRRRTAHDSPTLSVVTPTQPGRDGWGGERDGSPQELRLGVPAMVHERLPLWPAAHSEHLAEGYSSSSPSPRQRFSAGLVLEARQSASPTDVPEWHGGEERGAARTEPYVNIRRLNAKALRRYSKNFNLPLRSDVSRAQLVHEVQSHFAEMQVDEQAEIAEFLRVVHEGGNARDSARRRSSPG